MNVIASYDPRAAIFFPAEQDRYQRRMDGVYARIVFQRRRDAVYTRIVFQRPIFQRTFHYFPL